MLSIINKFLMNVPNAVLSLFNKCTSTKLLELVLGSKCLVDLIKSFICKFQNIFA